MRVTSLSDRMLVEGGYHCGSSGQSVGDSTLGGGPDEVKVLEVVNEETHIRAGETLVWRGQFLDKGKVVKTLTYMVCIQEAEVRFGAAPLEKAEWTPDQQAYATQLGVLFVGPDEEYSAAVQPGVRNVLITNHGDRVIQRLEGVAVLGRSQSHAPGRVTCSLKLDHPLGPGEQTVLPVAAGDMLGTRQLNADLCLELRKLELGGAPPPPTRPKGGPAT